MVNELVTARHDARPQSTFRRVVDAVIAGTVLFVTLPLMVVIIISIQLESRGPIFEREPRVANNGRRFSSLKFRTDFSDRESNNRLNSRATGLTRVGEFIRYSRIEYLPELVNVVRGELSFFANARPRLLLD